MTSATLSIPFQTLCLYPYIFLTQLSTLADTLMGATLALEHYE
jgi:hypothetical protein